MAKIEIISVNEVKNPAIYPLGPLYLAKALERDHEIQLFDFAIHSNFEYYKRKNSDFNPDHILISIRNIMDFNDKTKQIVDYVKNSGVPFVIGGPAVTVFKEHAKPFLGVSKGNLFYGNFNQNASSIFPSMKDTNNLDEFKMPDGSFKMYTQKGFIGKDRSFGIVSQLGCPYKCIYCSYPTISGKRIRSRNIDRVVKNLETLIQNGVSNFFFADPVFNAQPQYSLDLCKKINDANYDAKFDAFINPRNISEEQAKIWADMDMKIELGIDGLTEKSLNAWSKKFSTYDVSRAINILNDAGVNYTAYVMFGAPGQTVDDVKEELNLLERLNPPCAEITAMPTIYPATALYDIALNERVIRKDDSLIPAKTYCPTTMDEQGLKRLLEGKKQEYGRKGWGIIHNQYSSNPTL